VLTAIAPPVLAIGWAARDHLLELGLAMGGALVAATMLGFCTAIVVRILGY